MTFRPFIDLGHGGPDTGHVAGGIVEAEFVWRVGLRLCRLLAMVDEFDTEVSRTETEDPYKSVRDDRAREFGADMVLSLHADAQPKGGTDWRGATCFHWNSNAKTQIIASEIAQAMPPELKRTQFGRVAGLGGSQDNYPRANAVVARFTPPTVLVEMGFLSSPHDSRYLKSRWAVERIAVALMAGVIRAASLYGG